MVLWKRREEVQGYKKVVVKKNNTHTNYKIFGRNKQTRKMNVIRSYRHEIFSETINKIALSTDDVKRIILHDQIYTYS